MAGFDVAMAEAQALKAILEQYNITTSIELLQGRGEWYVPKYLVMNHHTATVKGPNLTPALYICKYGRQGIPGPLCNGYGGYDFVFRIITMGLANHPGQGGPVIIDGVYVPQDSMRSPSFGIEWEGGYHQWTTSERVWMATVNKAITQFYHRSIDSQLEHKTWAPTRKVDRVSYTRAISIEETSHIPDLNPVSEDDEVYILVRRPRDGDYFLVNGFHKRYLPSEEAINQWILNLALAGTPVHTAINNEPFTWNDHQIDCLMPVIPGVDDVRDPQAFINSRNVWKGLIPNHTSEDYQPADEMLGWAHTHALNADYQTKPPTESAPDA